MHKGSLGPVKLISNFKRWGHRAIFSSPVVELMPWVWRCPSSDGRRPSSVASITTLKNAAIQFIYWVWVSTIGGLCLPDYGGSPYIFHEVMARKPVSHIFDFFSRTSDHMTFILCQNVLLYEAIKVCSWHDVTPPGEGMVSIQNLVKNSGNLF